MAGPIRWPGSNRRTCSLHVLLLLVLLLSVIVAGSSRVRSTKHRTSRTTSHAGRWQSRASTDGTVNTIHEFPAKPAPFSKAAHTAAGGSSSSSGPKKRSYYVPTVTNLENFINNLKTGIGASKLAHAVNGVTGAIQQAVSMPGHGPINLLGSHRPVAGIHNAAGYYANANELRYGQPFTKQAPSHYKSATAVSYGKKPGTFGGGKRVRHSSTASPPGKYDSLMSDLGISGYKHFENAVIRDLERREELKVEATIHTLFPDTGDDEWRPIASIKKTPLTSVVRGATAPEQSESKIVTSLVAVPTEKQRPQEPSPASTAAKPKPISTGASSGGRYGLTSTSVSPKATSAPNHKHRSKSTSLGKEKRTKERVKCWNCVTSTTTTVSVRPSGTHPTTPKHPSTTGGQSQRFGPTYDASMFYGNGGKAPAAVAAQSYSNVEIQYNRTHAPSPPFAVNPWIHAGGTPAEVSTQSAPPVTTFTALSETVPPSLTSLYVKKSYAKAPKPYAPATGSYLGQSEATTAVTSTTTHKPTGGSQGTKGTTKKRTTSSHHHHRVVDRHGDSAAAGSSKSELRVKKKFDPKYSRNRGTIKFKDALENNPDQIYR